jgi:hypothetical protein
MRRLLAQWFIGLIAALAIVALPPVSFAQHHPVQAQKGASIRGQVVRVQGPDRFVVRTPDKKEVILHANDQTKFLHKDRVVRFNELREGIEINAVYDVIGDQNLVSSVTLTPDEIVAEDQDAVTLEGTIVRILETDNQIVVRTARGDEKVLIIDPRSKFFVENRAARLVDFRTGMPVRVSVDVRNQKNMVRTVVALPRK